MGVSSNVKKRKEDSVFFPRFAGKENGSSEAQGAQIVRGAQSALPSLATTPEANGAAEERALSLACKS